MKTTDPSHFLPRVFVAVMLGSLLPSPTFGAVQNGVPGKSKPSLSEQSQRLLQAARVEIAKAGAADNEKDQNYFLQEAQTDLKQARRLLQQDHDQKKAAYEAFPKFIPQEDDDYVNRQEAEIAYIRAQLELATCSYTQATAHPNGSAESQQQLQKAAKEFQTIHQKYRSMVAGLYARAWQGKCFHDQGKIGKALGIYNELLAHPGRSKSLQHVQDQTRLFRLQCLNSDSRKDYKLVINEAEDWLSKYEKKETDAIGLGILFQKAKAHARLADQLEQKTPPPQAEIKKHRETGLEDAKTVVKFSNQDQNEAKVMVKRLEKTLGE